jgi:hypothetical protein
MIEKEENKKREHGGEQIFSFLEKTVNDVMI